MTVSLWSRQRAPRHAGPADGGQGLVEYALILALVAIIAVAAALALGGRLDTAFHLAADCLQGAGAC